MNLRGRQEALIGIENLPGDVAAADEAGLETRRRRGRLPHIVSMTLHARQALRNRQQDRPPYGTTF